MLAVERPTWPTAASSRSRLIHTEPAASPQQAPRPGYESDVVATAFAERAHLDRPHRVLVVDDEENITFLLSSALRHFGFDVKTVDRGQDALREAHEYGPDMIVLDVMLPNLSGFDVVRRLRHEAVAVPVLFLTARDTVEDKVRGLSLGGDDYVTKPFSIEEILARVQASLRRQGLTTSSPQLTVADLEMDEDAHVVRRGDRVVALSPTEYNLLRFLLVNAGRVVTRDQILDHVWQYDFDGRGTVVETYISYLRKKLALPPLIHTVRGVGYSLRTA